MSLKRLIDHQKIQVENHSPGQINSESLKPVHIHKTFIGGKRKRKSIRISIDGSKITFDTKFDDHEIASIKNEINEVLKKNSHIMNEFAEMVAKNMDRWSNGNITIEEARIYASNMAEMFNLKPKRLREFVVLVEEKLSRYISIHKDDKNKLYLIDQNANSLVIAQNKIRIQEYFY